MKQIQLLIALILVATTVTSQNIGINSTGATPHSSAILDIDASPGNNKGLLVPRIPLQATNLAAPITAPATSLLVFNTATASTGSTAVTPGYYYWDGVKWMRLQAANAGSSSTSWDILGNSGTVDGTNFLGTRDNVPLSFRVNNQKAGRVDNTLRNSFYGYQAGNVNTTGTDNTFIGSVAGLTNSTGIANTAIGSGALLSNTTGSYNAAIGSSVLSANTTGSNNIGTGHGALFLNTTGSGNTGVGFNSMYTNTTGNYNAAFGHASLFTNTTGSNNTAIGTGALFSSTTGSYNAATGYNAMYFNQSGSYNVANGYDVLLNNTSGHDNTANGVGSLYQNTTGEHNNAYGKQALYWNTTGKYNTALGTQASYSNTTGDYNIAIGHFALYRNTSSSNNIAIGNNALFANTTGNSNTAVGDAALQANTTGWQNTALGQYVLQSNTSGWGNVALGFYNLQKNTTGYQNTAVGTSVLHDNTTGYLNTAVGLNASEFNTTGSENTSLGSSALWQNTTGNKNTALGQAALNQHSVGIGNTGAGFQALSALTSGDYNTAVGYGAASNMTVGTNNTFLGKFAGPLSNGLTNATAIGYNSIVGQSNALVLGGTGADAVNVGIGTATPTCALQLEGFATLMTGSTHLPTKVTLTALGDNTVGITPYTYRGMLGFNAYLEPSVNRFRSAHDGGSSNAGATIFMNSNGTLHFANLLNTSGVADQLRTTDDLFNSVTMVMIPYATGNRVGIGTQNPLTRLEVMASGADGISIKGGPLSGGQTGDLIFLENGGTEKGRISTENAAGVGGLVFSGSNATFGANHMAITQAGNVGIGAPAPTFKLQVNGTTACTGNVWTSDKRKKQNITPLELSGLDIINKLNPVSYEWIDVLDDGMKGTQLGFIAQELETILPSIVVTANDETKSKAVKYNELLPIYAKAIKEQQAQIEQQQLQIKEQQLQMEEFKKQLDEFKNNIKK